MHCQNYLWFIYIEYETNQTTALLKDNRISLFINGSTVLTLASSLKRLIYRYLRLLCHLLEINSDKNLLTEKCAYG